MGIVKRSCKRIVDRLIQRQRVRERKTEYEVNRLMILTLTLAGCSYEPVFPPESGKDDSACRGVWTERVNGELKKFNEYWHSGLRACVLEPIQLSTWEATSEKRARDNVTCTPQPNLSTMWLKAENNFYSYRDNKIFIHLDASTGIAKRLIIGITDNGKPTYMRQEFCYYLRTDTEVEPVNPQDHGQQILFDLELSASSALFTPMEIFKYQAAGPNVNMVRFDMNNDIDWTFCPTRKTP